MADLTITPANVIAGSNATTLIGTAGATVTAGQVVYKDATDSNKYKLADCDSATAAVKVPAGLALNGAANGQPLVVLTAGDVTLGAVMTAGTAYYLSPTPGGIAPVADVLSGDDVVLLGIAKSTSVLHVSIVVPGVTL